MPRTILKNQSRFRFASRRSVLPRPHMRLLVQLRRRGRNRSITLQHDPVQMAPLAIILDREMLNRSIVPKDHGVRYPTMPVLVFRAIGLLKQNRKHRTAFLIVDAAQIDRRARIDVQDGLPSFRMLAHHRVNDDRNGRAQVSAPTSTSGPSTHSAWPWRLTSWTPASSSPRSCSCSGTFVTTWKPGLRGFCGRRHQGADGSRRKIDPGRPL